MNDQKWGETVTWAMNDQKKCGGSEGKRAKLFWTGRSQAVRLPKEYRFAGDSVLVCRDGNTVVLAPVDAWPVGYVESFAGVPDELSRPPQGQPSEREPIE